ncbi:hypothetical protein JW916_11410 [Candidatus Sumerlaeota bacterium]|nr:hypothetical protein [Candidatus Sumerlaeota bacterium]
MRISRFLRFPVASVAAALALACVCGAAMVQSAEPDPVLEAWKRTTAEKAQRLAAEPPAPAPAAPADSNTVELASEYGWTGQTTDQGSYGVVRYVVPKLPNGVDILHTVTITIPKPMVAYEIRVYRDFDGYGPVGDVLSEEIGFAPDAGTLNIRLSRPVKVAQGDTICIWARIVDNTGAPAMALAFPLPTLLPNSLLSATDLALDERMNSNPGWTAQGAWGFGPPTGALGEGVADPTSGATGTNVYGYNLSGDYSNSTSAVYLTTPAVDCSLADVVELRFWRWLGVQVGDVATVEVSNNNGTTWQSVWVNPGQIADASWAVAEYDISTVAAGSSQVRVRWGMGPTDATGTSCGWNIDDVQILASTVATQDPALDTVAYQDVELGPARVQTPYWDQWAMFAGSAGTSLYLTGILNGEPQSVYTLSSKLSTDEGFRKVLPFGTDIQEGRFVAVLRDRTADEEDYNVVNADFAIEAVQGQTPEKALPFHVYDLYNPISLREIEVPIWGTNVPWPDHPDLGGGYDFHRRMILNDVALAASGNFLVLVSNRYQDRSNGSGYRFWWDLHAAAWDFSDPYNPTMVGDWILARTALYSGAIAQHVYWYYDYDGVGSFTFLPGTRLGGFGYVLDPLAGTMTPTDLLDKNVKVLSDGTTAVSVVNSLDSNPRDRFTTYLPGDPGDVVFCDVSQNPPALLSWMDAGTSIPIPANDTVTIGNLMYVADAQAGVVVVNVANPASPEPLKAYTWAGADVKAITAVKVADRTNVYVANQPSEFGGGVAAGAIWLPFVGPDLDLSVPSPSPPAFSAFLSPSGENGSWTNITLSQQQRTLPLRATIGAQEASANSWFLFE